MSGITGSYVNDVRISLLPLPRLGRIIKMVATIGWMAFKKFVSRCRRASLPVGGAPDGPGRASRPGPVLSA